MGLALRRATGKEVAVWGGVAWINNVPFELPKIVGEHIAKWGSFGDTYRKLFTFTINYPDGSLWNAE